MEHARFPCEEAGGDDPAVRLRDGAAVATVALDPRRMEGRQCGIHAAIDHARMQCNRVHARLCGVPLGGRRRGRWHSGREIQMVERRLRLRHRRVKCAQPARGRTIAHIALGDARQAQRFAMRTAIAIDLEAGRARRGQRRGIGIDRQVNAAEHRRAVAIERHPPRLAARECARGRAQVELRDPSFVAGEGIDGLQWHLHGIERQARAGDADVGKALRACVSRAQQHDRQQPRCERRAHVAGVPVECGPHASIACPAAG
ncbi:MAG: hypothetical protein ACTHOH_05070 [Lysobacteraceae bacterium]